MIMPYYVIRLRNGGCEQDKVCRGGGVSTRAGIFAFDDTVELQKEYTLAEGTICFFRYKREADEYANTTYSSSEEELVPCPFCSNRKVRISMKQQVIAKYPHTYSRITAKACCVSCRANGPEVMGYITDTPFRANGIKWTTIEKIRNQTIIKWNKRGEKM